MEKFLKRVAWQLLILALFWFSVMSPTPYVYGTWVILQTAITVLAAIVCIFMFVLCSNGMERHLRDINIQDYKDLSILYLVFCNIPDFFYVYYSHINDFPYISVCLAISMSLSLYIILKRNEFIQKAMVAQGIREIPIDSHDI